MTALWRNLPSACVQSRHRGSAHCTAVILAESLCRASDRLHPPTCGGRWRATSTITIAGEFTAPWRWTVPAHGRPSPQSSGALWSFLTSAGYSTTTSVEPLDRSPSGPALSSDIWSCFRLVASSCRLGSTSPDRCPCARPPAHHSRCTPYGRWHLGSDSGSPVSGFCASFREGQVESRAAQAPVAVGALGAVHRAGHRQGHGPARYLADSSGFPSPIAGY